MFLFPIGFMRAVAASSAVNPTFNSMAFTAGGSGTADSLTPDITYDGADTLEMLAVTSSSATAPSQADIEAELGTGTLESFTASVANGVAVTITGLTAASEAATHVHAFIREATNGGVSATVTTAVSGLDFTLPTFSSAEATDANTVVVTHSENVFGTGAAGDWAFTIGGAAATITGVVVSGATATLTVSDTMTSGDTLAGLAYTPGDLVDGKANALAAYSGQAITNSIAAAGVTNTVEGVSALSAENSPNTFNDATTAHQAISATLPAGRIVVVVGSVGNADVHNGTVTIDGVAATLRGSVTTNAGADHEWSVWDADVDGTGTGEVVVTWPNGSFTDCNVGIFAVGSGVFQGIDTEVSSVASDGGYTFDLTTTAEDTGRASIMAWKVTGGSNGTPEVTYPTGYTKLPATTGSWSWGSRNIGFGYKMIDGTESPYDVTLVNYKFRDVHAVHAVYG